MRRTAIVTSWQVCPPDDRHACSLPRCRGDAVAYRIDTVGYAYNPRRRRHQRRRWVCAEHLACYNAFIRSGRVFRTVGAREWLADLAAPWPPRRA